MLVDYVQNGKLKAIIWLCGVILTVAISLGLWNLIATVEHGNRLECVETDTEASKERLASFERRMDRFEDRMKDGFHTMDGKLDTLIDRLLDERSGDDV